MHGQSGRRTNDARLCVDGAHFRRGRRCGLNYSPAFAPSCAAHLAPKTAVTPATPVIGPTGYRSKPLELQALHRLQVKNSKGEKDAIPAVTPPATSAPEPDQDEIAERAALAAGSAPAVYLETWARLNHRKPVAVSEAEWRQALDDGGRFLDTWGAYAAEWHWTAGELFDVLRPGQRGGLLWFIAGSKVEAFGPDHARLDDERVFDRQTIGGEPC
jgi:hypothetical protein